MVQIPVISPTATNDKLSDKSKFPYFMRTIAPDAIQASVIVKILVMYGWRYIATIHVPGFSIDSYPIRLVVSIHT